MLKKLFLFLMLIAILIASLGYYAIFASNCSQEEASFYLHKNQSLDALKEILETKNILQNQTTFNIVAQLKNLKQSIKPGHYTFEKGMSNNHIINMLKSGNQSPVKLTIHAIQNIEDLSALLGKSLMHDSAHFANLLMQNDSLNGFGFSKQDIACMILPNTYEVYWTISAKTFLQKMQKAYQEYWTPSRLEKAKNQKLTPKEVCILASIAQKETARKDEAQKVAGVYINRLRIGMAMQADPTLIFALQDRSIRRVLNKHKEVESPYNTYKYAGLPPGPIDLPQIYVQNAILDYQPHNYLYFCAKEDFSGYHNFATTHTQHMQNARRYQKALNKQKIFK